MKHTYLGFVALAGTLVGACGQSAPATDSAIAGVIAQQSFAQPVTKLTVRSNGVDRVVAVDASGAFKVSLAKGQSYQLLVGQPGGAVPIVLRRGGGRLDTTVTVSAGGAQLDLGKVSYWQNGSVAPPPAQQSAAMECSDGEHNDGEHDDGGVDCVDGIDAATGAACDGGPAANGTDGADGGVDCVDGIDAATGAACDGGPDANANDGADGEEAEDTDCSQGDEMGLPDNDLPDSIGCAGDDDGDHQDGEEADD